MSNPTGPRYPAPGAPPPQGQPWHPNAPHAHPNAPHAHPGYGPPPGYGPAPGYGPPPHQQPPYQQPPNQQPPRPAAGPPKPSSTLLVAALILLTSALSLALVAKDKAQDLANPIFLATAGLFIVGSVLLVVGLGKRMGGLGFALGAMGALASAACMVWLVTKVNARSAPTKKAREADFSGVCEDSSAKDKAAPKYDPSKPGKHPTVFYYKQPTGSWLRSNDTAYKPYKPEELSAEEIELIACVAEKPATVEVCQYTTDPAAQKAEGSLKRLRLDLEVKLVSLRTGKTIAEASVEGAAPPSCPPTQQLGREIDLRGARPEYTAVVASIVTHLKTK